MPIRYFLLKIILRVWLDFLWGALPLCPIARAATGGKIPKAVAYMDCNGNILYLCWLLHNQYKLPKLPLIPIPCLFHLNEFSNPLLIRIPPLIRDLRVDVMLDIVFNAL